jgi:hypothetical protein
MEGHCAKMTESLITEVWSDGGRVAYGFDRD